jgi:hypothetical protein
LQFFYDLEDLQGSPRFERCQRVAASLRNTAAMARI